MCVDDDSRPPIHPIAGGSAGSTELRLASADGKRFMAHAARDRTDRCGRRRSVPDWLNAIASG
jgi:hypothetical protein